VDVVVISVIVRVGRRRGWNRSLYAKQRIENIVEGGRVA
jgi:hypothetical protein